MLSKESIEKYKAIYKEEFGEELSDENAMEQATRLLNLARVVYQPMPKAWELRYNELLAERQKQEKSES